MPRIVRHEAMQPYRIEPQDFPKDKPIFICACGVSKNLPYCDGTHKECRTEEPDKLYEYGPDGRQIVDDS
ncbi:MAG: CDGSH iron-sulfur domain-containing protein [Phycisphaerales bacterium]|nr:CDGSH iron-sulfur domain-containing protein [Phycisphaerales bacterium]